MLSVREAKKLFAVDANTGVLSWKERPCNSAHADLVAGYIHAGSDYIKVMVNGETYQAHRIVWAIVHGEWPSQQIDHINGVRSDNRPVNLRDVSSSRNQKNCKLDKRNKSGVNGVRWRTDRGVWEASIRAEGLLIHLGRFKEFEAAVAVRKQAELGLDFFTPIMGGGLLDDDNLAGKKSEG